MADTPVSPTPVDALPTNPNRLTQTQPVFESNALAFTSALTPFRTQVNTLASNVKFNSDSAFDSASEALSNATLSANSAAAANFKGRWSDLTGALAKPASASNGGRIWILLNDLADVTLSEPGVTADWEVIGQLVIESRTSDTIITTADIGKIIRFTTGGFTQTFESVGNLFAGFFQYLQNASSDAVVLDPFSTEEIDGRETITMYPGEMRLVMLNEAGDGLKSFVINSFSEIEYLASGAFVVPTGYSTIDVEGIGGGGGGASTAGTDIVGGGSGGEYVRKAFSAADLGTSQSIVVGAGGAGKTGGTGDGSEGGSSSFGSLLAALGGNPGRSSALYSTIPRSAQSSTNDVSIEIFSFSQSGYGGRSTSNGGSAVTGGGGGGGSGVTAGGGGQSELGGSGGNGATSGSASNGDSPGGGGGGCSGGGSGGSGGSGVVRVRGIV